MKPGILVVAKAPVSGESKTRLGAAIGMPAAADLAAAALLDSLDAGATACDQDRRVIALTGDLDSAARSAEIKSALADWTVISQRGKGFGERLASAHADAARKLRAPVVQIGMDSPQVTGQHLRAVLDRIAAGNCDAVLGPASDGGWWLLALAHPRWAAGLRDVPMSTAHTGAATQAMLRKAGARVVSTSLLDDVDTVPDAQRVAALAPESRFAQAWRHLVTGPGSPTDLFDEALAGASCTLHGLPGGPVELPVGAWRGGLDEADRGLVAACSGPTLDVGCGPGRLTQAIALRGGVALGIDVAAAAVDQTRARGAQALRRDVFAAMPAEGRWDSVLLADGNIGIGGDPVRLLRRAASLLSPRGTVVVEVGAPGSATASYSVRLEVAGRMSSPFAWALVDLGALETLAGQASLRTLRVLNVHNRWIAQLGRTAGR
jgi:glycosyltransferase A (GT-A) superfamily protein (DUF2064 family)/SAM-dependent methyltransferase